MNRKLLRATPLWIVGFLFAAAPASAHHVMGGRTPSTFIEGLLSGLGHPVIGPDHLAILLAIGIIIAVGGLKPVPVPLFVLATAAGVLLHVNAAGVPAAEIIVALSVLIVGFAIARGRGLRLRAWPPVFALAGLFHGYAFGESIYGAEKSSLGAYLLGLVLIQTALALGIVIVIRRLKTDLSGPAPRLAGAAIAGVGFATLTGSIISAP